MNRSHRLPKTITLKELCLVFLIMGIVALILFPIAFQPDTKQRGPSCLANLKQIGAATQQYLQDYDERIYPHRFNCNTGSGGATLNCPGYYDTGNNLLPIARNLDTNSLKRYYWVYLLGPYTKSYQAFVCPQNPTPIYPGGSNVISFSAPGSIGTNYGGQNSYGYNAAWLSPPAPFGTGNGQPALPTLSAVPRIASTILATDASYYVAVPDLNNWSGLTVKTNLNGSEVSFLSSQGAQYTSYWKNLGNANWSASGGTLTDANAVPLIRARHADQLNTLFVDGHIKAMPYQRVVGDICLWTTDTDGPHPQCN